MLIPPKRAMVLAAVATVVISAPAAAQTDWTKVEVKRTELAPGVHVLEGAGGNIGMSAGEDGVILIDSQFAPLHDKLLFAIRQVSDQPIRFVLNTHIHGDHVGGNEPFAAGGAVIIAHENVRTRLSTEQFDPLWNRTTPPSPEGALPVVTFTDNLNFHMNGQTIHALHVANAHTDGDVLIHFENRNVIHMGDCFFNGFYPRIDVAAGGSLRGMIRAADVGLLLADGATKIIPGHGPVAGRTELRAFRDMLQETLKRIEPLVIAGQNADQIARAKPLADLDAKWGKGFMTPERFIQAVVADLSR